MCITYGRCDADSLASHNLKHWSIHCSAGPIPTLTMTKPSLVYSSSSLAAWESPLGQKTTTAPPLPVNLAAAALQHSKLVVSVCVQWLMSSGHRHPTPVNALTNLLDVQSQQTQIGPEQAEAIKIEQIH